jgi:hypothetical protein
LTQVIQVLERVDEGGQLRIAHPLQRNLRRQRWGKEGANPAQNRRSISELPR